eukprot:352443-Chlamydomonas_euryale.AAC.4
MRPKPVDLPAPHFAGKGARWEVPGVGRSVDQVVLGLKLHGRLLVGVDECVDVAHGCCSCLYYNSQKGPRVACECLSVVPLEPALWSTSKA